MTVKIMKNIIVTSGAVLKKNGRRVVILAAAFALILAAGVSGFLYHKLPERATFLQKSKPEERISDVMKIRSVQQTFTASRDGLSGINLKFQLTDKNTGHYKATMNFVLYDQNGTLISRQTILVDDIVNYTDYSLTFPTLAHSEGSRYTMRITPDLSETNEKVDMFVVQNDGGGLKINGQDRKGRLEYDGVYRTSRLGSLYNGRHSDCEITLIVALCSLSVLLLCGLIGFFLAQEE